MGARNVAAAYQRWAGKVPGTSMQILVYMALVSKDSDDWPWYGQGQASLAEMAMGRPNPGRADLRAVQRAMTPLLDAGAVTVDRAGAARNDGNSTARYRLNITDRGDAARHKWQQTPVGKRRTSSPPEDPQHPTKSGSNTRRKVTQHPTVSDPTPDGNRRTKDKEKIKRSEKTEEEDKTFVRPSPLRASEPVAASVVELFPGASREPPYRSAPTDRTNSVQQAIAEATARRRAAEAAHRAAREAQ
jgi:hypothetical protein